MENESATCDVCFILFDVDDHIPRVLIGCGHTLCSSCLKEILRSPNLRKCPFDNQAFLESQNSPEHFPVNFALLALLEVRNNVRNEVKREARNEIVDQLRAENSCKIHKQQELTMVCLQDKVKICSECAVFGEHKGHSIKKIDELRTQGMKAKKYLEEGLVTFEKNQMKIGKEVEKLKKEYVSKMKNKLKSIKSLFLQKEPELVREIGNLFEKNFTNNNDQEIKKAAKKRIEEINQACLTNGDLTILLDQNISSVISSLQQPQNIRKEDLKFSEETLEAMSSIESFLTSQESSIKNFDLKNKRIKEEPILPSVRSIPITQRSSSILEAKTLLTLVRNNDSLFIDVGNSVPIDTKVDLGELNKAVRVQVDLEQYDSFVQGSADFNFLSEILSKLDHYASLAVSFAPENLTSRPMLPLLNLLFCRIQHLAEIDISFEGCQITNRHILLFCSHFLPKAISLKNLKLNLNSTQIDDESLSALANFLFPFEGNLESFSLLFGFTNITDGGFEKISHVISGLRELNLELQGTLVTDQSLKILRVMMSHMKNLKKFRLNGNDTRITIEGVNAVFSGMPNNITDLSLNLSSVEFSDEVLSLYKEILCPKLILVKNPHIRFGETDLIKKMLEMPPKSLPMK